MSSSGDTIQVDEADAGKPRGPRASRGPQRSRRATSPTLEIPIVQGRAIGLQDGETAARVAVVNETLARRMADGSALGRTFRFGAPG